MSKKIIKPDTFLAHIAVFQEKDTLANPASMEVQKLESAIDIPVLDLYGLTAAERQLVLATRSESCEDGKSKENHDDPSTITATRSASEPVAGATRRRGKRAGGNRQQVLNFTLSSMALENEPVNPQRLAQLLNQPAR